MKVAVEPLHVTVPETEPLPPESVKVVPLMVEESIPSLKVAAMLLFIATSADPFAGLVELTVGAVVSPGASEPPPPPPPQPPQAENTATIKKINATVLQLFISFSSGLNTDQTLFLRRDMHSYV